MWAEDELLEDTDAAAVAETGFAHRLDVEVQGQGGIDVPQGPRFAVDRVVGDAHAVSPLRVLIAETDHVEVIERRELQLQLITAGTAEDDLRRLRLLSVRMGGLLVAARDETPQRLVGTECVTALLEYTL